MFDHDTDQSLLLILAVLAVFFALPFVMAWLEATLPDASRPGSRHTPGWVTVWNAARAGFRAGVKALSGRKPE